MKIAAHFSHLNGFEWLAYHHEKMWGEIEEIIAAVDAGSLKTKNSKEKTKTGQILYSPPALNKAFRTELTKKNWVKPQPTRFYPTDDVATTKQILKLAPKNQKSLLTELGKKIIPSFNAADFLKNRVALEVQFGKYSFVQFDIFIKHSASYMNDQIDLGIEIVPMKVMAEEMSSGVPYYEKHLHEILRQGRIFPPVPLILIGIVP